MYYYVYSSIQSHFFVLDTENRSVCICFIKYVLKLLYNVKKDLKSEAALNENVNQTMP